MDGYILVEEEPLDLGNKHCTLCGGSISAPYYYTSKGEEEKEEKEEDTAAYWEGRPWAWVITIKKEGEEEEDGKLYVHKACGDLPNKIEHKLHPGHSLRRSDKIVHLQACSVCKGSLDSVQNSFNCSDCQEFALDISCALKLFPIAHKCHQHPLIPVHGEEDEDFLCVICRRVEKEISYECATCSFRVHQLCLSSHFYKPHSHRHGLKLIYSLPENHSGGTILCHVCGQDMKEEVFAYYCARCAYFFHTYNCRTMVHFRHEDPLVLVEEVTPNANYSRRGCNVCQQNISVPYYACTLRARRHCRNFFLHKICAELPQTLKHHLHPEHTLMLLEKPKLNESYRMCSSCHLPWGGLSYSCAQASCCFNIDIVCAMKTSPAKHEFHQHPLISSHAKASFPCAACDIDSEGTSYECPTCRFWVHQQCASLPKFKKNDLHPHNLKLTYAFCPPGKSHTINCQVCREKIKPHRWAYQCAGCKYYTHVHDCEDPNRKIEELDYEAALASAVNLPPADESVRLATLFFIETNQQEDKLQDTNRIKSWKMPFYGPNETRHKFSNLGAYPCNNCAMCKYILLKSPSELQDPSRLKRYCSQLNYTEEKCNGIMVTFSGGWGLSNIRISSSVLPRYVKHEGHKHVLSTTYISKKTWCNACEFYFRGYGFRCNICKFTIDTYCALLPGSITHRYDKRHPFKLTYYSTEGVEEYVCEICEGDITTMWFYHCEVCDHSIHKTCIWKIWFQFRPSVKYGFDAHKSV